MRRPLRRALATLLGAAVVSGGIATPAGAGHLSGIHDARYCEIIALKGTPPNAVATVWNTIGLNRCPAATWNSFDAGSLAIELGAGAVVLNGPRHFLMDSVTAQPGRVRSFHGMRLRRVATIRIRSAEDLARTPYTDRTVKRDNVWHWNSGRVVYELVAPGGDVSAKTTRPPGPSKRRAVNLVGATRLLQGGPGATVEDRGTIMGKPFGRGSVTINGTLAGGAFSGTFRIVFPRGSVYGTAAMPFTIAGNMIHFRGTSTIRGGTGAFRGISAGKLTALDDNTLDGQNGVVSLKGFAAY